MKKLESLASKNMKKISTEEMTNLTGGKQMMRGTTGEGKTVSVDTYNPSDCQSFTYYLID
jgi:hypothetical protein